MTEIEKLEAEARAIKDKLAEARTRATEDSLRESFGKLSADESLSVSKIVAESVGRSPLSNDALASFAERIAHFIKINSRS